MLRTLITFASKGGKLRTSVGQGLHLPWDYNRIEGKHRIYIYISKLSRNRCHAPYNVILGTSVLNVLGNIQSIRHMSLKYPLPNGHVGTKRLDNLPIMLPKYLKVVREPLTQVAISCPEMDDSDTTRWDPRLRAESERLTPTKDLKEVQIRPFPTMSLSWAPNILMSTFSYIVVSLGM